ncbi:CesT family type III secretion system chaperone [Edwardsiella anguillarum]|nr:CesT family type III secretion system chaperone [Edwardsiella anguillarum]
MQHFHAILHQLASLLELDNTVFQEDQSSWSLEIDQRWNVHIVALDLREIVLFLRVAPLSSPLLAVSLLQENLFTLSNRMIRCGLDNMQSIILWNQQSISNTDGGELYQVLLSLIHKAEEIEQMVQKVRR